MPIPVGLLRVVAMVKEGDQVLDCCSNRRGTRCHSLYRDGQLEVEVKHVEKENLKKI